MKFDLNRLVHLKVRGKLIVAFLGLSLIPILVVWIYGISVNVKTLREIAIENLRHDVYSIKQKAESFMMTTETDIHFLSQSYLFKNVIHVLKTGDPVKIQSAKEQLENQLLAFVKSKKFYYQIRYIDVNHGETFSIESVDGDYRILTEKELGQVSEQYYFWLVKDLPPGKTAIAPVELTKRGKGLIPAISYAFPIFAEKGQMRGVLILNVFAEDFFRIIEDTPHWNRLGKIILVNNEGFYLYHSERKKNWNQLLVSDNLFKDYPQEIAERILTGHSGTISEGYQDIIAYAPLLEESSDLNNSFSVFISVPKETVFQPVRTFKRAFIGFLIFFLVATGALSYLATQQFTKPIAQLQKGSEVIAQGDFDHRLQIGTGDEIEELAKKFNLMARSIKEREREIQRHKEQLEEEVLARTRELCQEKNTLQAILDNVPSAFVLLDKELRILTASAVLQTITGQSLNQVKGKRCQQVLYEGTPALGSPSERSLKSGRIETCLVKRSGPDGQQKILEHIAIPLKKAGRTESILEIITDVTERLRLQEQLIRSEKLATTGEMAAVLAHEMRNALTSIKMILQLQLESDDLSSADKESLEVAIDSIHHLESVVNDLLQFARPAPLNRRKEDLNQVIEESIEFSRHHLRKKSVHLTEELDPNLPLLAIDRERMKEVLVNLLLNASQAVENAGSITIKSTRTRLPKEIRDYVTAVDVNKENNGDSLLKEIVLKKASRVVRIDVKDNGCGIPQDKIARIFDPFYTTKFDGTGLGLSLVKRIVNEHGGVIQVESVVGKGSTFSVLLPIS